MNCPACGSDNALVLDSRPIDDGQGIRRRRECRDCGNRFTSYEYLEGQLFRTFAADLRALIDRYEGGAVPNGKRRIAPTIQETPVSGVVPTATTLVHKGWGAATPTDEVFVHDGWAVPTMRERLKERRKEEES